MSDSQPIQDIRAQLKEEQKARAEMEKELADLRSYRQQGVFKDAGFDPDTPAGRALAKLHDGEFTVEAIQQTAAEYGLASVSDGGDVGGELPAATVERQGAQQVMAEARREAQPAGGARMSHDEFKTLVGSDPRAAASVLSRGQVDMPAHIARQMGNQNHNPLK